jgi:solute carrier family 26 (sodium-independent sulfate anion transporter), member 11
MSASAGRNVAKVLGIKLQKPEPTQADLGNGDHVYPIQTLEQYLETSPTTTGFLKQYVPSGPAIARYLWSLFPFLHWIDKYNVQWLIGDLVAGKSQRL